MLTWGALHIVGASPKEREKIEQERGALAYKVQSEIDDLGIESDGHGWQAKVFLYCVEAPVPANWLARTAATHPRHQQEVPCHR